MSHKGNSDIGCLLTICAIVGIVLFITSEHGIYIIAAIAAVIVLYFVISAVENHKNLKNITHVEITGRSNIYDEGYENTGFSVGTKGSMRFYFGKKKRLRGKEVTFHVSYSDKDSKIISAMEDTSVYNKLMEYVYADESDAPKTKGDEPKKFAENSEKQGKIVSKPVEETKQCYYIDVPFEVIPNDYHLTVHHQSCQMIIGSDCKEVKIMFEVNYDQAAKGANNRRLVCALLDKDDKIVSVVNDWKSLSKSGGRILDLTFWQNITDEPSKIRIGLEQIN